MSNRTSNKSGQSTAGKRRSKKTNGGRMRCFVKGAVALLAVLLVLGVYYVWRNMPREDRSVVVSKVEYPIHGIDVSNHNGKIDFEKVAADSIVFVYIKASEGVNYKDPRFDTNISNARNAGLKVGAYHFFRKDKDGAEQARNFMRVVKDVDVDMPYVIDVEDWGNSYFTRNSETVRNLRAMVDCLEKAGMRIMVYTNKDGYRKYLKEHFPEVKLWLCTFMHPDKLSAFQWDMHQYSHWGTVSGIQGEVDLDVFNGNCEQWERWLREK